jgi:hypothetical protein
MSRRILPLLAICLVAGCSKIHEQRSFDLKPMGGYSLHISAPVSEQKVKITVSSDQPIEVWVLLEKDIPESKKDDPEPEKMTAGVLASEKKVKDSALTATVPGKEAYCVFVQNPGNKTATVTVKVDSQ